MKNKNFLPIYISMELLITVGMIIQANYYAAAGWGFLMLTNISTFVDKTKDDTIKP